MDLIQLYNSGYDKHSDKGNVHTYIQSYYAKEFILPERVRNVLEIGIMFGGSHMLWHDYFKAANIVGMDINEGAIETLYNNSGGREYDRLDLHAVDAYTQEAVDKFEDNYFNYIIDDGPHTLESQEYAVKHYLRKVRPGGKLIIEDVQSEDWFERLRAAADPELVADMKDINLNLKKRYDDRIFEITRK